MLESYAGFAHDFPRHQMPPGLMWNLVDWIPDDDGSARKRGAVLAIGTGDFASYHAVGINNGTFCAYCPFSATPHEVVAVAQSGELFRYVEPVLGGTTVLGPDGAAVVLGSAGVSGYVGSVTKAKARPVFHRDQLVMVDSTREINFYAGAGALPIVGTSTPHASCATLWGDYTVAGNVSGNKQRIFFSNAGDPRTWDMTNSWLDLPGQVIGVQGIRGALIAWTDSDVWRIRGDTPPQANVIGNLVRDHLFDVGLVDERSIATYGDFFIWANAEGVWMSNGASTPINLADRGGIGTFWRALLKQYTANSNSFTIAGGVFRGHYIISVLSVNPNVSYSLACNLSTGRWFRLGGNAPVASMYAHNLSDAEDLYFVSILNGRVASMANVWEGNFTSDHDGNVIQAIVETPFFRGFQRLHRRWIPSDATSVWQRGYVNFNDGGNSGDVLTVSYTTSPVLGKPYTLIGNIQGSGGGQNRKRFAVNPNGGGVASPGIAFKIQSTVFVGSGVRLNDFELEFYTREGSR